MHLFLLFMQLKVLIFRIKKLRSKIAKIKEIQICSLFVILVLFFLVSQMCLKMVARLKLIRAGLKSLGVQKKPLNGITLEPFIFDQVYHTITITDNFYSQINEIYEMYF